MSKEQPVQESACREAFESHAKYCGLSLTMSPAIPDCYLMSDSRRAYDAFLAAWNIRKPEREAGRDVGIIKDALHMFLCTQKLEHYSYDHWSNRAARFLSESGSEGKPLICECDEISNGETCVRCGPPAMRNEYCIKAFATWAFGRGFNLERGIHTPFSSQFTQGYYELWQELWECFPMQRAINHAVAKLHDMIDGGEECRGRDSEISDVIRVLEQGK